MCITIDLFGVPSPNDLDDQSIKNEWRKRYSSVTNPDKAQCEKIINWIDDYNRFVYNLIDSTNGLLVKLKKGIDQ